MKTTYKNIIKTGKIHDNSLVNFPQHILAKKNCMYSIEIKDESLKFKLDIPVNNYTFRLPLINIDQEKYPYNFTVNWGDDNVDNIISFNDINTTHNYSSSGTYIVSIKGDCWRI